MKTIILNGSPRGSIMIIRLKNGMDYFLLKSEGKNYLLTDKIEKTDSSFEHWRTHYRKEIDLYDECVEECYDVSFHVVHDVDILGVTDDWRLFGDSNLEKNIVYLNDDNQHDGWEFVERGWSRKKIDLRDVKDQYVLKEICIKNGMKCIPKKKEKVHLSREEFVEFWKEKL